MIAEFDIYGIFVPALVIFAIIAFLRESLPSRYATRAGSRFEFLLPPVGQ